MPPFTGKRKREDAQKGIVSSKKAAIQKKTLTGKAKATSSDVAPKALENGTASQKQLPEGPLAIQIVTGSYERVLHGLSATIPSSLLQSDAATDDTSQVSFSDTFLFAAHASSIRCLAVSPPTEADKRYLATGSSDERINVYSISTAPPNAASRSNMPSLSSTTIVENSANRSLGSLIHHDRAITRLAFPAKGKLFSAAEDNTVAISRTRDWTVLSSIKAPIPKAVGRPSGDTAAPGEVPTGVNDFAIHPSQKLMLSVGRGERSMRLWNLMTGKKAGVLNFDRDLLMQVGEGKHSTGEGRRVLWDEAGENYVVGFERGAVLFGIDSQPKAVIKPASPTKLHQHHVLSGATGSSILAMSTEDGRILFYDLDSTTASTVQAGKKSSLPQCVCIAQLGGSAGGVSGRIKDFDLVSIASTSSGSALLVVTASSDGAVRIWYLSSDELINHNGNTSTDEAETSKADTTPKQIGKMIATHESGNRITCLAAFAMDGKPGKANGDLEEDDGLSSDKED